MLDRGLNGVNVNVITEFIARDLTGMLHAGGFPWFSADGGSLLLPSPLK